MWQMFIIILIVVKFISHSAFIWYSQKQVEKEEGTVDKHGRSTDQLTRENWDTWDPMLISEGLFAAANIFSNLKLVYIFSVNPYLGPLQVTLCSSYEIWWNRYNFHFKKSWQSSKQLLYPFKVSLSRMVMDILKFISLFVLVLFAFSCGKYL